MLDPNADKSPFNALPPVVVILAVLIGGIEIVFQLGAAGLIGGSEALGWRIDAIRDYAFFDSVFEYMRQTRTYNFFTLGRFLTYSFVHVSLSHAAFAVVLLLALGKAVGDVFHWASTLAVFFLSAIAGALVYGLFFDLQAQMTGSYNAIYGLIGAYTWMLWLKAGATGESRTAAFRLIGLLLVFQIVYQLYFVFVYDVPFMAMADQWAGRLVGFVTGFVLSFVLAPDGRARIGRWLSAARQR